jgi:Sorting nexin C terminal
VGSNIVSDDPSSSAMTGALSSSSGEDNDDELFKSSLAIENPDSHDMLSLMDPDAHEQDPLMTSELVHDQPQGGQQLPIAPVITIDQFDDSLPKDSLLMDHHSHNRQQEHMASPQLSNASSANALSSSDMQAATTTLSIPRTHVQSSEQRLLSVIYDAILFLLNVHKETKRGPWQLGPIDTTRYDHHHLEEPALDLFAELFQVYSEQRWLYTQFMFFVRPIVQYLGGPVINRLVIKGIHGLMSEESIVYYIQMMRVCIWPSNQMYLAVPVRSVQEKLETRMELEGIILGLFQGF